MLIYYLFLLLFSPWGGLGRDCSSVRRLVYLWSVILGKFLVAIPTIRHGSVPSLKATVQ